MYQPCIHTLSHAPTNTVDISYITHWISFIQII